MIGFASIKEALSQPTSQHFWIAYDGQHYTTGNNESFYSRNLPDKYMTYDCSNQKVTVNVGLNGTLQTLNIFRSCYKANAFPEAWPGVWVYKDFTTWGPYAYRIQTGSETIDLSHTNRPFKTTLLDNLFPITQMEAGDLHLTILTFAPISKDGSIKPRGVIYGIYLENTGVERLTGHVLLPEMFSEENSIRTAGPKDALPIICDVEICLADDPNKRNSVPYDLDKGQSIWIPTILYAPGEPTVEEIDQQGTLYWLNATWSYFRDMLGRLSMPQDVFTQEFYERSVLQCYGSVDMDGVGNIAGANWGTYPATAQTWMKDMYYVCLPFYMLDPTIFQKEMLWFFEHSLRYSGATFRGGVRHSLGNALTPVMMAGLYYASTGDADFFCQNPAILSKAVSILNDTIDSRDHQDIWLFPSDLISDGDAVGDFHTGTNICAWFAFQSFGRVLKEVYLDKQTGATYLEIADKIRETLESHNVIEGPFGLQYIEGVNADGSIPYLLHDGEESDTTLIPFYGYAPSDHLYYKNYARFALTEMNLAYSPETKGIKWGMHADSMHVQASFPGYITGLANIVDAETMHGENGFMTQIRRLTDMDGSVWWWPYPIKAVYGEPLRNHVCGKCGWAAGAFTALFVSQILGISYDAPTRQFSMRPFSPSSDFLWENLRYGTSIFSIGYERYPSSGVITFENKNTYEVTLNLGGTQNRVLPRKKVSISL